MKLRISSFLLLCCGAQLASAGPLTTQDVVRQLGEPDEIIERSLQRETDYRYGQKIITFKDGKSPVTASRESQPGGERMVPRHRAIRAGVKANDPNPTELNAMVREIAKEGSKSPAGGAGAEAPQMISPENTSDF